jgi:hypothetical protein
LTAYYTSVTALAVAAWLSNGRVWGFDVLAPLPNALKIVLVVILITAPLVIRLWRPGGVTTKRAPSAPSLIPYLTIPILFCLAAYLLRERIFVLGDGYQTLAFLSHPQPYIKPSELGELLVRLVVRNIISGDPGIAALTSYRLVSIGAGSILSVITWLFAVRIFRERSSRLLFTLAFLSGGFSYLYFGYVENYSLFSLSVAAFCFVGVLAVEGYFPRWLILVPTLLAIFFHVAGIVLLAPALYVLGCAGKNTRRSLIDHRIVTILLLILPLPLALIASYILRSYGYFFTFSLLPLTHSRFTVDDYAIFSGAHLLDTANLMFLLVPSLLLLVTSLVVIPRQQHSRDQVSPSRVLLLFTFACSFSAVFILDPKLGMPRDWDLLSFASIPLLMWLLIEIMSHRSGSIFVTRVIVMALTLNVIVLFSRAFTWANSEIGAKQYHAYLLLDRSRNRTGWRHLIEVYRSVGDLRAANQSNQEWAERFPEYKILDSANELGRTQRMVEAEAKYHEIMRLNPMFAPAYANLGLLFYLREMPDTAAYYLEIADALQPHNSKIMSNFARALEAAGDVDRAMQVRRDSAKFVPDSP